MEAEFGNDPAYLASQADRRFMQMHVPNVWWQYMMVFLELGSSGFLALDKQTGERNFRFDQQGVVHAF